jgi:hypothetical protein
MVELFRPDPAMRRIRDFFDHIQHVKRHWYNRNRIKTAAGLEWLTF